jgi:hypothetical protein
MRPAQERTRRIHVVVTCSHRKTRPIPASLRLRSVTAVRAATRARNWTARLASDPTIAVPASSLYAGAHWDIARRLPSHATASMPVAVWVCSAGYGLIPADAPIRPYSATFAAAQPDSVPGGRPAAVDWWAALSGWTGPTPAPRSLTALAAQDPASRLLLVLSAPYLAACRADVLDAAGALADASRLSVVSAGTKTDAELTEFLLPTDARLEHALGGTRQSLNVRVAEHLLASGNYEHAAMRDRLTRLLADQPPPRRFARRGMTDEEVRVFIRGRLEQDADVTHTRLLRELRNSDRACEQHRFADLFHAERAVLR